MDTVTLTVDKQQDQLPLDEQCFSALHSITAHLNDNDFVEINRPILQLIGFRNSFIEKKDSKRNLQSDVNGHPLLKDMRNDFSTAVRCLRNTTGFIEGSSLTDTCAHFVLIKKFMQEVLLIRNRLYGSIKMLLKDGQVFKKFQEEWLSKLKME